MNHHSNEESCCSTQKAHQPRKLIVLLLLVSIGASVGSSYFFSKQASKDVLDGYLAIEYAKNGGKENYDLITEAQRLQLAQQLPQIREFVQK